MRLAATTSLMERRDVIVVATVSCIYGLGSPEDYRDMRVEVRRGETVDMRELMRRLVMQQYERNDAVLERSRFRVRGDVLEIFPSYAKQAIRIEFFGNEIERIRKVDPLSGEVVEELDSFTVYPAKYFVMPQERLRAALQGIRDELGERHARFIEEGKLLEAERLKSRTEYDLEMLEEMGYCSGIENYSRHLSGRKEGERPAVLLDFFPPKFLAFVDESHVTLPQVRGMYEGDRSRKLSLVRYGFRLPSALDNRPLVYSEFESLLDRVDLRLGHPGSGGGCQVPAGWRSRSSGPRGCWTRRSSCGRPRARWRTCTPRSGPRCRQRSAPSSRRSPSAWPRTSRTTSASWA